jgi:hypothetical protein
MNRKKKQPLTFRRVLLEMATATAAYAVVGFVHIVDKITDAV